MRETEPEPRVLKNGDIGAITPLGELRTTPILGQEKKVCFKTVFGIALH